MRSHRLINPDMITRALVRQSPLRLSAQTVRRCPPHRTPSRPFAGRCCLRETGNYVTALVLHPRGVISVQNPEFVCGKLASRPFYAFGGTAKAHCGDRVDALRSYVEVPTWTGDIEKCPVLSQNQTCGVTTQLMRWVTRLAFASPESFSPGFVLSYTTLSSLCHHCVVIVSPLCHHRVIIVIMKLFSPRPLNIQVDGFDC